MLIFLKTTVILFIQLGILVKSTLVLPEAVTPPADILVRKLAPIVGVPPNVGLLIVGLVNVLFVNVWVSEVPTTVPEGAVVELHVAKFELNACTSVPMTTPRAVLAADAELEPVPPLATAKLPVTPVVNGNPVQLVKVPADGVPMLGVVKVGLTKSALVATAVAMLLNSVSISVPLTIFKGLPEDRLSLVAKFVLFV